MNDIIRITQLRNRVRSMSLNLHKAKKSEKAPSLKPPKGWWEDRMDDARKQYPKKSEEQRKAIVGGIWQNYDEKARKKIRESEGKKYGKAPVQKSILGLDTALSELSKSFSNIKSSVANLNSIVDDIEAPAKANDK